ncbi:hypothetical protein ACK3SF_05410 [Candidatus Nanosalina sp. VS9-1]|uniref:hypothetical protein n=1 Tax=Candidatus Nanosalina sp. VS9-1 TaxID=3388566 RepID=UPI0039DF3F75
MEKRHIIYGAVFVVIFALGSFNVATDGEVSYILNNGEKNVTPEIDVENNLTIGRNQTGTVEASIQNAQRASYTASREGVIGPYEMTPEYDISPRPRGVLTSLPPYWVWDKAVGRIDVTMEFNSSGIEKGNYSYGVEAWNNESYSNETFHVVVE